MSRGPDDLLPLFLSEARERLDRLATLVETVESDQEAAREVRRELHAIKGASRMMGLQELAALAHEAEDAMAGELSGVGSRLTDLLDRMAAAAAAIESGPDERGTGAVATPELGGDEAKGAPGKVRVGRSGLARLTERATELRVLAVGGGPHRERLLRLADIAGRAASEGSPAETLQGLAVSLRRLAVGFDRAQSRIERLAERQLEGLLELQVQPLRPFLQALARHARDLARSLGREVKVVVSAGESHLDRRIISSLEEAFLHLVRNAVDHGVEPPGERLESGKPKQGKIVLRAESSGGRVVIEVADDGRGVRPGSIREAAVRRGLLTEESARRLSDEEALQLVFRPGFTVLEDPTEISGRGVGLDAVASAVWAVGGDLRLRSAVGRETTVSLELPVARRGERVVVLRSGGSRVGLLAGAVRRFTSFPKTAIEVTDGRRQLRLNGRCESFQSLSDLFQQPGEERQVLVEGNAGGVEFRLAADAVEGEEEVLIHSWPAALAAAGPYEGIALLSTGRPVPVLAPHVLGGAGVAWASGLSRPLARGPQRVLLVDDSHTTREMIRRLLEEHGLAVVAASSAEGALRILGEQELDCLVTDIEMEGMDGLELTRRLRRSDEHRHLPVVVVSTRDRPEDRLAGLEAGADAYLTKQGLVGQELIETIRRVGEGG